MTTSATDPPAGAAWALASQLRRLLTIVAVCAAIVVGIWSTWAAVDAPISTFDGGITLANPHFVRSGLVPTADFESTYPPGAMYTLAAVWSVTGESYRVSQAVGLVTVLVAAGAVGVIGRRRGVGWLTGAAAFAVFAGGLSPTSWAYATALLVVALALADAPPSPRQQVAVGVALGLMVCYRLDAALPGLAVVGLVIAANEGPARPRAVGRMMAGGAFAVLPLWWLLFTAGPSGVARLVLLPSWMRVSRSLPLPALGLAQTQRVIALVLVIVAMVIAGVAARRSGRRRDGNLLAALGAALALLLPFVVSRFDVAHTRVPVDLAMATLPVAVACAIPVSRTRTGAVAGVAGALLLLLISGSPVHVSLEQPPVAWVGGEGGRAVPLPPAVARHAEQAIARVRAVAPKGSRLFTGPADLRRTSLSDLVFYWLLADHPPAGFATELNPNVSNRPGNSLLDDLHRADVLILDRGIDAWNEKNGSRRYRSDAPNRLVRREFCRDESYGPYDIYLRC